MPYSLCGDIREHDLTNSIGSILENACERYSNRIAVIDERASYTYKELKVKVAGIIYSLVQAGIKRGDRVAVLVSNNAQSIFQILAVTSMGAAYVPIDETYPCSRRDYILKDCEAVLLLTKDMQFVENKQFLEAQDKAEDTCYIIYTSGSTGHPKGVVVRQKGVINLCFWYISRFLMDNDSGVLSLNSLGFDASVKNIFSPLFCGARIILNRYSGFSPANIVDYIREKRVTHLNGTPGIIDEILEEAKKEDYSAVSTLEVIVTGGETFSQSILYDFYKAIDKKIIIGNVYGPTEGVSITASHILTNTELSDKKLDVPIGKVIDNKEICLMSKNHFISKPFESGELLIGGIGIADRYLNQPELTSEKFIQLDNRRFYRSGDLCYFDEQRNLHYKGRLDRQIKRNGYRIELDEISSVVEQLQDIRKCITIYYNGAIYCIYTDKDCSESDKVKKQIERMLPEFMLPNKLIRVEEFEYTVNGKVDYNKMVNKYIKIQIVNPDISSDGNLTKKVLDIWIQVLNNKQISIYDNFFDVGGNSLKLFQMVRHLENEFHIAIEPIDIMSLENIVKISRHLQKALDRKDDKEEDTNE